MRTKRVLASLLVGGLCVIGTGGCEQSNESEAKIDSTGVGGPGGVAPVKQQDYYKAQQQKNAGGNPYGKDYPGGTGPKSN